MDNLISFPTILIDPNWNERGGGKCKRGADRHYKLMSVDDIIRTIWTCPLFRPAEDAHLYLWATNDFLMVAGAQVMPHLGFRYITAVTWPKRRFGIGQYFRGQTEHMLFGVRGSGFKVRTARRDLSTLLPGWEHPERKHSAKPPSAHELIEARSKGPYLELFAREQREGWKCWGDELTANSTDD